MKLYNSLTRSIDVLNPLKKESVTIYSCGPTVYSNLHIGNLATFIRDDLLKRALRMEGYKVKHVMNMTDVDDKTIRDSKLPEFTSGDPMQSLMNLTNKYSDIFMRDIEKIGNDVESIEFIKATDTIDEMLVMIQAIVDGGMGYITDDGVYLSIQKYIADGNTYGLLQQLDLESTYSRIDNDEYDKDSASDFALWKATTPGEPSWQAKFNISGKQIEMPGRPGWHIECSAMSQKMLGLPFDIHTGGIDLKFPHHENEIAQSTASGNEIFAKMFVHMSHILVDGRKMSKSLNNFYTLRDIEQKNIDPKAFRLLVLSSHYQKEINFTWDAIITAHNHLQRWRTVAALQWQLVADNAIQGSNYVDCIARDLYTPVSDNLNTPLLLANIDARLDQIEKDLVSNVTVASFKKYLRAIDSLMGLDLADTPNIPYEIESMIERRWQARIQKNWELSDTLRNELSQKGIGVRDTLDKTIWYYL